MIVHIRLIFFLAKTIMLHIRLKFFLAKIERDLLIHLCLTFIDEHSKCVSLTTRTCSGVQISQGKTLDLHLPLCQHKFINAIHVRILIIYCYI